MNEMDVNRLEAFGQLKEEIRGSGEHLIVGIDVGKEKHQAFFGTARGKTLFRRLVFSNDRSGFERVLMQAEAVKVQGGLSKVVFGLEPTGNYHKALGEYLISSGEQVVLTSGTAVKNNRQMLDGRWDKNETKDSANVADLVSQSKFLFYDYPEIKLRDLRGLLSLKRRLKKQEHGTKVRIRNHLLAQYFPELDPYANAPETMAIVRWCLAPSKIVELGYDGFVRLLGVRLRGLRKEARLRQIWEKAAHSIGCEAGESVGFEGKLLVDELSYIRKLIGATEAKINEICGHFEQYGYLLSIPGFGPDVSAKVLAGLGDPFRFKRASEVLRIAGLDLSADRSGKRAHAATPVISKRGKADLRYALYQAALVASTKNPHFIVWFTHCLRGREKEKGIKTKMRVKLSAKLLIIAWTLMKNAEPFDPRYLGLG